ncbi:trimethylamine methyltransferase family protein [Acetohalobium arabaticum]|uniref:Trimethylamine methyltransferase n=1 Tax=Acetohalobium arabaticum (strain ATCC 49924 / DSM 5501 / Z-7288) TaxID=574087 RepID=D9QUS9_ACEAZ|nr:trimethylamine methyltransferase family protein [Acetohalobium arabaticum]ADL11988.1 trimethylamine methyltransferase [Acetohalobium arabaticum DSM 5501]
MRPKLNFFSEEEIERIHNMSLDILESMGMKIPSEEALGILEEAGADIDGEIAKFTPELIENAVETAPKRDELTLYARDEEYDINLSEDAPVLAGMTQATNVIDVDTREKRPATNEDVGLMLRVLDQLDNVSIASTLATPQDVPEERMDQYTWATAIKNTKKHITAPSFNDQCVKDAVKMGSIAVGGEDKFQERPFFSTWVLTSPPLELDAETASTLMEASRHNIPTLVSSGPILGVSAPVTIAGGVAQAHAENMACLVLSQAVNPGAPFIYTSFARIMDMKVTNISMASPEFAIMKGCMAELGHLLDLPTRMPSMLRDSKKVDAQAGFEVGMGLVGALESEIIGGLQLDMDIVIDFADLVFSNECMGQLKRIARGVEVNDNNLARELISEVGHGGDFLKTLHTAQNFKDELWDADLVERRMWEYWEDDGCLDMEERALARVKEMIEEDTGPLLDEELQKEIDAIAKD